MVEWAEVAWLIARASLTPCADSTVYSNVVDIFNVTSGAWSTAALSVARWNLAATSLPNLGVAIFAGGSGTCLYVDFCIFACFVFCSLGNRMLEWTEVWLLIACANLMPCAGGSNWQSILYNVVDIFNVTSGTWSTAALSAPRRDLAATSLPNHGVAIFAGGQSTCCHDDFSYLRVLRCFGWGIRWLSGRRLLGRLHMQVSRLAQMAASSPTLWTSST